MKGSSTRSGPAPDPNALRRDRVGDAAGWTTLPAAGRSGEPPLWPLTEASDRELHFWRELWAKPQAAEWERLGLALEVALYVRRLVEVEEPGRPTSLGTLVKQLAEQLGLTIPGMRMLRWKIGSDQVAAKRAEKAAEEPAEEPASGRKSARDRFRVVDGAAG